MTRPACPVCGFVVGDVSPRDGAVALRSFPRRYTELLSEHTTEGEDPEHRRQVVTAHADAAARGISAATAALEQTLIEDEPTLDGAVEPPSAPGLDAIDRLRAAADRLAELADRTGGPQWKRTAFQGGEARTALELFDDGVHAGAHHLRLAANELG